MVMDEIRINIAEAKAKLSQYVRRIKNGESILLCERNVPVAEIRPLGLIEESQAKYLGTKRLPIWKSQKHSKTDPPEKEAAHPAWGAMAGTVLEFPDDFNEPEGDSDWEASR